MPTVSQYALGAVGSGWGGVATAASGVVYGTPYSAGKIAKVDPSTLGVSTFGSISGHGSLSPILAPNGKIYGPPHEAAPSGAVKTLVIDPSTDTVSLIGGTFASHTGSALHGTRVISPTWNNGVSSHWVDIDTATDTVAPFTPGGSVSLLDDFNRADAATLGAAWTTSAGTWNISSSRATPDTGECFTLWNSTTYTNTGVGVTVTSSPNNFGVVARSSDKNNMYLFQAASSTIVQLYKRVSGTWTLLGSASTSSVVGKRLELTCDGTTITGSVDGIPLVSVTDASHLSGYVGMRCDDGVAVDDFVVGTFAKIVTAGGLQGVAIRGGKAYGTPGSAAAATVVDLSTGSTSTIPITGTGSIRWLGAIVANTKIYSAPQDNPNVLAIYSDDTYSLLSTPMHSGGWGQPAIGPDGLIYFPPRSSGTVLTVDPSTDTVSTLGSGLTGDYLGITRSGDKMFALPVSGSHLLVIDFGSRGFRNLGLTRGARSVS